MSKEDDVRKIVIDELKKQGVIPTESGKLVDNIVVYTGTGMGTINGRPFKLSKESLKLLLLLNNNAVEEPITLDNLTRLGGYKNAKHARVQVGRLREHIAGNQDDEQVVQTIRGLGYQLSSRVKVN